MEPRKEHYRDSLTNEKIIKKFISQFDLVNYAIRLAENMIHTGRDPRVKVESQSRAMQILGEIALGKDVFDELPPASTYGAGDVQHDNRYSTREPREAREPRESRDEGFSLKAEKKRSKRSLTEE